MSRKVQQIKEMKKKKLQETWSNKEKLMKIVRRKQLLQIAKDLKNPESLRLVRSINNDDDSNSFDFVHEVLESLK